MLTEHYRCPLEGSEPRDGRGDGLILIPACVLPAGTTDRQAADEVKRRNLRHGFTRQKDGTVIVWAEM